MQRDEILVGLRCMRDFIVMPAAAKGECNEMAKIDRFCFSVDLCFFQTVADDLQSFLGPFIKANACEI